MYAEWKRWECGTHSGAHEGRKKHARVCSWKSTTADFSPADHASRVHFQLALIPHVPIDSAHTHAYSKRVFMTPTQLETAQSSCRFLL